MRCRWIWLTCLLVAAVGCTELPNKDNAGSSGTSGSGCVDRDGDGFGDNCGAGRDCNDFDPATTNQCQGACAHPSEGCECAGEAPISCFLPQTANSDGTTLCREGTRTCRDGLWTGCEGVHEYTVQPRQDTRLLADVFPRRTCSDCERNCFVAEDHLGFVDGGIPLAYATVQIEQIPAGGVTVRRLNDAAVMMVDAGPDMWPDGAVTQWPIDAGGPCLVGMQPLDLDCDNIPNYYDRSPGNPDDPFDSPHETIVSTTPSDQSILVDIADFEFELRQADVYFALDTTAAQVPERLAFINAINGIGVTTAPTLLERVAGSNTAVCYDFDRDGLADNFPAGGGLIDAIRCFTGDTRLGLGSFNEVPIADSCSVPFTSSIAPTSGTWTMCEYGSTSDIAFRNLFDVSDDFAAFRNAAWRLPAITPRLETAQAGTQALWALASGSTGDLYYGPNRPAFGARADCPAGTYGAACFRNGVMPITFMFTGSGQHNGPLNYIPTGRQPPITINTNPRASGAPYIANNLAIPSGANWGTPHDGGWRAQHLAQTGETPYSPLLLSATPLDNRRLTFTGSTIGMTSDVTAGHFGCGVNGTPDTFLSFDLAAATNVTFTLTETSHDSNGISGSPPGPYPKVLSVFSTVLPPTPYNLTMMSTPIGGIQGTSRQYNANTAAGFTPGVLGNLSACGADGQTNEASITFSVPAGGVRLMGDMSLSGGDGVVDIYSNAPLANPVVTNVTNVNDTFATAHVIPTVAGGPGYVSYRGNTSAPTLPANVPATSVSCGASAAARDAVYRFHANSNRQVVIDTEGLPGDIDSVISLHYAPPIGTVPYVMDATGETTTIDNTGAITSTGFNMGAADNAVSTVSGNTTGAAANFAGGELYSCGTPWAANQSAADQVVHFTLSSPTSVRVRDADGADVYDPAIAIFGGASPTLNKPPAPRTLIDSAALAGGTTGADTANAWQLGNAVGKQIVVEGADFTTAGKVNDFAAGQFGLACTNSSQSPDVVYTFTTTQPINARIKVDGIGLTQPMVALFNQPPSSMVGAGQDTPALALGAPVTLNSNVPIALTGATTAAANDIISNAGPNACNMASGANDVFYRIDVPAGAPQDYQFRLDRNDVDAFDPVLRLYPGTGTAPNGLTDSQTWYPNTNRVDTPTQASVMTNTITLNPGSTVIRRSDFGGGSGNLTDSTGPTPLCGEEHATRDAVFRVVLPSVTNLNVRAETLGSDWLVLAMFNALASTDPLTGAGLLQCQGAANTTARTLALTNVPAGTYYFVVKGWTTSGGANTRQDEDFRLTIDSVPTALPDDQTPASNTCDAPGQADMAPNIISMTRVTTRRGDLEDFNDHADLTCTGGVDNASKDAVYRISVSATTTVNLHAHGNNDSRVVMAVFPTGAGLQHPANPYATDSSGATITCDAAANDINKTVTLAPGDYYVVVKAHERGNDQYCGFWLVTCLSSPTAACPCGCGTCEENDDFQDDDFYLEVKPNSAIACADTQSQADEPTTALGAPNANSAVLSLNGAPGGSSYYLAVTSGSTTDGQYYLSATRSTSGNSNANMMCGAGTSVTLDGNSGMSGIQDVALPAGTYYLVVKGDLAGSAGTHRVTIQDTTNTDPDPSYCLAANATTTQTLPAGDYWAVIKGTAAATTGDYVLEISDLTAAAGASRVNPLVVGDGPGCDNNSGPSNRSRIVANLTPTTAPQSTSGGDYWIVVKGASGADSGPYQLNVRDVTNTNTNFVTCAGGTGASAFDVNLLPGNYTATFKGVDGINGPLASVLFDETTSPSGMCVASGTPVALSAGRNIIALKGNNSTPPYNTPQFGEGAYQLTVSAGTPPVATPAERAFASKSWTASRGAVAAVGMKVVPMQSCEPGTDWGTGAGDGGATGTTFSLCGDTYSGPLAGVLWLLGSILAILPFIGCILFDVIALPFILLGLVQVNSPLPGIINNPVSCATATPDALYASVQTPLGTNPPRGAWPQSKEIARTTGTVDTMGNPIAAWLQENPSSDTVAYEITRALHRLSQNLRMDVSMEMVWDSTTTPVYVVQITANSPSPCSGGALAATHRDCAIGSHPQFRVQFLNPSAMPVPQNPDPGWNGGWPGRLRIMGDLQFVLDEIPVFLIPPLPNPMGPPMPPMRYAGPGVYRQDIGTRECMGTNLPDWTDLYFRAEMAPGTSIQFEACAQDDLADLNTCMMQTVATVTATNVSCFSDVACRGMNGYCGPSTPDRPGAFCRTITPQKAAGLCGSEAECPDGTPSPIDGMPLLSDCVMSECTFDSPPADIGAALGADNFRRFSRMEITLRPDGAGAFAPNLLEWSAVYVCTPAQ